MKKIKLILNFIVYYILGFTVFTVIAYAFHISLFAFLTNDKIIPQIEIKMILHNLRYFFIWYISIYTVLYFLILYSVHRYDVYIVNKLNENLNKMKGEYKNE